MKIGDVEWCYRCSDLKIVNHTTITSSDKGTLFNPYSCVLTMLYHKCSGCNSFLGLEVVDEKIFIDPELTELDYNLHDDKEYKNLCVRKNNK